MKSTKLYIEFVGISGSGKTTLSNKLYEKLAKQYRVIELPYKDKLSEANFAYKGFILWRYYLLKPKSFLHCINLYFFGKYGYKGSFYTLLRRKFRTEKYFNTNKSDIILNNEGTLQLYRSKGDRITKTNTIPKYHSIITAETHGYHPVLVNVEVDIETAVKRCTTSRTSKIKPEKWSLFQYPKDEQYEYLKNWNINKNIVVEKIESFGIRVIQIDSSHPIEKCISEILNHLKLPEL